MIVYPNPSNGVFTLSYDFQTPSNIEISLFNVTGQKIETLFQGKNTSGKNILNINTQTLPKGFYFVSIKANNQLIEIKKIEIF